MTHYDDDADYDDTYLDRLGRLQNRSYAVAR